MVVYSCILASCAGTENGPDTTVSDSTDRRSDCIFQASIRGYTVLDESNLVVESSGRRQYHLTLRRRAHGLESTWQIGFESPTGRICSGFSEVVFGGHTGSDSVRIANIQELSPEEHEDLLIRFGKKEPEFEQTPVPNEVNGAEVEELDPAARSN